MKIRTLAVLAGLLYLPLISNAGAVVSQNPMAPQAKSVTSTIRHDHDIVIVYGGEDVGLKQLNQDIMV